MCYDCMGFGVLSIVFLEAILVLSGRRARGFRLGLLRSWKVFILILCLCMLMICDIPLDVDKK